MKKILALVLALALVMMVGGAALAADKIASTVVTVSGLTKNDEATFYKIIEWVGDAEGNVAGWKATETFAEVLTENVLKAVLVGTPASEGVEAVEPTGITPALANQLAKKITTSTTGTKVTVTESSASITTEDPGTWMVLVKPADVNTVYNPIFVSADFTGAKGHDVSTGYGDSTAKKSTLKLEKTAENKDDYTPDHADTTAVGDIITYTVKATIPAYGAVYTNPHYALKDTLTDLKLVANSIEVTGGPTEDDYSVSATDAGYTILFNADYLKTITTATEITVTYKAEVTSSAEKAINEESNDVMIEYSHDPSNESDYDVKKDTTQHYTFTIDAKDLGDGSSQTGRKTSEVVKIGQNADGTPILNKTEKSEIDPEQTWTSPLKDAEFGLWKNTDSKCEGTPYKTATTGEDGRMTFSGLDAGTYYLKEIQAPAGFVTSTEIHTVVIHAELETKTITEYWNGSTWVSSDPTGTLKSATYETKVLKEYKVTIDGDTVADYTFKNTSSNTNEIQWTDLGEIELPCQLINVKGTELPHTGGIGTTIFYILGGLLVVGAVVILVARRKAQD